MSDTLALWILFGLLSVAFVAMQFAFRPKPPPTYRDVFILAGRRNGKTRLQSTWDASNVTWKVQSDADWLTVHRP